MKPNIENNERNESIAIMILIILKSFWKSRKHFWESK